MGSSSLKADLNAFDRLRLASGARGQNHQARSGGPLNVISLSGYSCENCDRQKLHLADPVLAHCAWFTWYGSSRTCARAGMLGIARGNN